VTTEAGEQTRPGRPDPALRICFISTALQTGGAEMMLLKLLSILSASINATVISLADHGTVGPLIEAEGVSVHALGLGAGSSALLAPFTLSRIVRAFKPDVIQGWMYHGNLAAALAAQIGWRRPVLWAIRQSLYDISLEKKGTAAVIRTGALLSAVSPVEIIYNSTVAARQHEQFGYDPGRTRVIPNGFDIDKFTPRSADRADMRAKHGISDDTLVVGLVARFHPMKGHAIFLRAGAYLRQDGRDVCLVMVGRNTGSENASLASAIRETGMVGHVLSLGERSDMSSVNSMFDVVCSASSWGEGFPNAIGEAMACGIPCVVTDIGDSALVVGETGMVVQANDPRALASAIASLHDAGRDARRALGLAARKRVIEKFSLATVVSEYESLFHRTAERSLRRRVV
jgi:glycosyltransferase involved in cell wall biosynthesis